MLFVVLHSIYHACFSVAVKEYYEDIENKVQNKEFS